MIQNSLALELGVLSASRASQNVAKKAVSRTCVNVPNSFTPLLSPTPMPSRAATR